MLSGLLRLLLLLVPVLAVVHDLRDGRVGLGRHLDEVEVLAVRVLAGLVGGLDSELCPVVVDQPDVRDADRVVDAHRVAVGAGGPCSTAGVWASKATHQVGLTPPCFVRTRKAAACSGPFPRRSCDSVEPPGASGPGGEERVRPCFSGSSLASFPRSIRERCSGRLLAAALAHREALLGLAVAVDDRERDLLQLGRADPLADRLGRARRPRPGSRPRASRARDRRAPSRCPRRPAARGPAPARARTGTRRRSAR